ncbi:MAG: acyl-CoA reductase [Chitinophagales bacterium]
MPSILWTMQAVGYLVELGKRIRTDELLKEKTATAERQNPWFTQQFVQQAVDAICNDMLQEEKLNQWLSAYKLRPIDKTVGLIFAGNIPLVGFHDFLCAYLCGCKMKIKQSSKDDVLFPRIIELLIEIDPDLTNRLEFVEKLKGFDAVIATGSDNTNRYFEYYFRDYPKILRKNRNSIAILNGQESDEELQALAHDVFDYFGFGCRNVSKLYIPVGYNFEKLFPNFSAYAWLHQHTKYMNNYDYNRTILLLNKTPHFANEFVMLVENESIPSPIGNLNFEYWHDEKVLQSKLKQSAEKIQCVVSTTPEKWEGLASVKFGEAQHPQLWDYADGVDTMAFLLSL